MQGAHIWYMQAGAAGLRLLPLLNIFRVTRQEEAMKSRPAYTTIVVDYV